VNAAREKRAKELVRDALLVREVREEGRNRDAEIAALAAELAQERQKVADLQANLERYRAKERILKEAMSLADAHFYRLRDVINDNN
jgi:hypothetical protein